uniref:Uncharacterized protein n=1 Tax=Xiphophorus couchianus TaxID=32473 RepID=A0A3B5L2N4_9TELE
ADVYSGCILTAGGSTAGGSTAGGSTAGGSTAGGSTAGGSTAGGSTAGGSTAGGSTAGGSTAGGSTAGGSTAGGSTCCYANAIQFKWKIIESLHMTTCKHFLSFLKSFLRVPNPNSLRLLFLIIIKHLTHQPTNGTRMEISRLVIISSIFMQMFINTHVPL